jgi:hypothetical protein
MPKLPIIECICKLDIVYKSYKLLPWIYFKIESANFIFIFDFTGNTSDLQEAISEGASSHSVGSVDFENDNFSDMISAQGKYKWVIVNSLNTHYKIQK